MPKTRERLGLSRVVATIGAIAAVAAIAAPAATAAGTTSSRKPVKPVIGRPTATPAQPLPGERFVVSFKVTRSDTGTPVAHAKMKVEASAGGTPVKHSDSFKAGVARSSLAVPLTAQGRTLRVKLTIGIAGRSATKVASYQIKALPKPAVSVADASVAEGNSGATTLSFPVSLSAASKLPVTVSYATAGGTAAAGSDYQSASGTLTFAPGEVSKAIAVAVDGDTAFEPDETLSVTLSGPVNATLDRATATGTIKNDDKQKPRSGHYAGQTSQGKAISFDVAADLGSVTHLAFTPVLTCPSIGLTLSDQVLDLGEESLQLSPDWKFGVSGTATDQGAVLTLQVTGALAAPGTATGTLRVDFSYNGVDCSTGDVSWNAG